MRVRNRIPIGYKQTSIHRWWTWCGINSAIKLCQRRNYYFKRLD